jgi:hypothetical protein
LVRVKGNLRNHIIDAMPTTYVHVFNRDGGTSTDNSKEHPLKSYYMTSIALSVHFNSFSPHHSTNGRNDITPILKVRMGVDRV